MTHDLALRMRNLFQKLFDQNETDCYYCAIRRTYETFDDGDYTLCLYGNTEYSIFLIELASLAQALDSICNKLHAGVGTYNKGTTEEDIVTCITLH